MRRVSVYLESGDSEALEAIAREAGCVVDRGRHKGRGSVSRLLRRVARQGIISPPGKAVAQQLRFVASSARRTGNRRAADWLDSVLEGRRL